MAVQPVQARDDPHLVMVTATNCSLPEEPQAAPRRPSEIFLTMEPHNGRLDSDVPPAAVIAPRLCTPPVAVAPSTAIPAKRSAQVVPAFPHKKLALEPEPAPASESTAEREGVQLPEDASTERAADTADEPVPPSSAEKMGDDLGRVLDEDSVLHKDSSGEPTVPARSAVARADSPDVMDAAPLPREPRADNGTDEADTASDTFGEADADDMVPLSESAPDIAADPEDDIGRPKPEQAGRRPATIPGATLTQGSTSASDGGPPFVPAMLAARPPVGNERRYANFRVADHPPVYCPWEINDSLSNTGRSDDESPTSPTASTLPEPEEPEPTPTPPAEAPVAEPSPPCGLCPQYDSGEMSPFPMVQLRLRRSFARPAKHVKVHRECAEWAPEVYWENDDELVNVDKAYARGRRLRCAVCSTLGATIGCHVDACRRSFHLRCLKLGNCRVDDDAYAVFCEAHVDEAAPALYRSATGAWACRVQED